MANVLVFYQYFSTPRGSWGTRYYELGRRWAAAGHKVTIVTSVYDKSDLQPSGLISRHEVEGMEIIVINVKLSNKHAMSRRLASFAAFSTLASYYAITERADVVIASSGPLSVGALGLVARWLRGRKLIFEARDLLPEAGVEMGLLKEGGLPLRLARALAKACYKSSTAVVALSPGMEPVMQQIAGDLKVAVIPNGADIDLFGSSTEDDSKPAELAEIGPDKFVVLYAGTLGRANSGGEFLDIAKELLRRGEASVQIVIIGDGAEKEALVERAKAEQLSNVTFIDKQSRITIAKWHRVASLIMIGLKPYPILQTSSPNKLFDALAAGRPVINNTRGWIADLLDRGGCGLTHDPGDVSAAVDHILKLKNDPALLLKMGRQARALAEKEFSRDRLAEAYMELF